MPNLSGIAENTINLDRLTEYDEAIKELSKYLSLFHIFLKIIR